MTKVTSSSSPSSSCSCKAVVLSTLEALLHTTLLIAPLFIGKILHSSDSLLKQIPEEENNNENVTAVGFGIRRFSVLYNETYEIEDVKFSDDQQDYGALGGHHNASHTVYHVWMGFMALALIVPLLVIAIKNRCGCCCCNSNKMRRLQVISKINKSLVRFTIPILMTMTLLMAIPFGLLWKSNLCGPQYVELGYQLEYDDDSSDDQDDHYGCGGPDYEGTYFLVHEDVKSSCQMGNSGIGFLAAIIIYPLVLLGETWFLNLRANQIDYYLEQNESKDSKNHDDNATNNDVESNNAKTVDKDRDDGDDEETVSSSVDDDNVSVFKAAVV